MKQHMLRRAGNWLYSDESTQPDTAEIAESENAYIEAAKDNLYGQNTREYLEDSSDPFGPFCHTLLGAVDTMWDNAERYVRPGCDPAHYKDVCARMDTVRWVIRQVVEQAKRDHKQRATGSHFDSQMCKYLGTRVIWAKPMTRGDYNAFRGWTVPADENPDDAGYLVEYVDGSKANTAQYAGYVSWSPADVFNRTYKPI